MSFGLNVSTGNTERGKGWQTNEYLFLIGHWYYKNNFRLEITDKPREKKDRERKLFTLASQKEINHQHEKINI